VLIPSTVYQKVGNLDYRYRHAIGDIDYGLRALKKGISLIIAPSLIGHCEKHDSYPIWCNKFQKLNLRLKYLYSPLGNNPFKFFIFEFRHFGLMIAIKHFFSIHLRAFIPQLWYKRKKQGI
jgi:GT2 family glycosyltransferase